jgi:anti-sigma B factor antagonist
MDHGFTSRGEGSWTVVEATGELDISNSSELSRLILEAIEEGATRLAVDLSRVTFMDSSTLGVLVGCLKRARERDGEVVLLGVNGSPRRVMEITGLDQAFTLLPSVGELPA